MERKALLTFKESAKDPLDHQLSSWIGEDSCKWVGVGCYNHTRHVVKLDLGRRSIWDTKRLQVESLQWLAAFPYLEYLNMGNSDLEIVSDWLQAVNVLHSLIELNLSHCGLASLPQSISFINFTLLSVLDLSHYKFYSPIPYWLSNVSGLSILNIASNCLRGAIPVAFAHLYSLQELEI